MDWEKQTGDEVLGMRDFTPLSCRVDVVWLAAVCLRASDQGLSHQGPRGTWSTAGAARCAPQPIASALCLTPFSWNFTPTGPRRILYPGRGGLHEVPNKPRGCWQFDLKTDQVPRSLLCLNYHHNGSWFRKILALLSVSLTPFAPEVL